MDQNAERTQYRPTLGSCRYCRGITLEALARPGGYKHASNRASLVRSAQKCKLCSLLFRRDRSRDASPLYLSLDVSDDEDEPVVSLRVSHGRDGGEKDLVFFLFTSKGMISFDVGPRLTSKATRPSATASP
jgi:hypothetical protein